jgi:uncharacterized RDD family membrane protein YckC
MLMNNNGGSSTYELASFASRLIAYIIDIIILSIISFVILLFIAGLISNTVQLLILDVLLSSIYYWYFWTRRGGQTPGKRLLNIRVIKSDGSPLSDSDALLRVFGYYIGRITLGLGYIWAAFDAHSQAWHDKMANTYVVVAPTSPKKTITL